MRKRPLLLISFVLVIPVIAHTEEAGPQFDLLDFLGVIGIVSVVVGISLALLRRFETVPGSLPIRKLGIVAAITIIVNSLAFGFIYREVLF